MNLNILIITLSVSCFITLCNSSITSPSSDSNIINFDNETDRINSTAIFDSVTDSDVTTTIMTTTSKAKTRKIRCTYYGGQRSHLDIRRYELLCCKNVFKMFKRNWNNGGYYLTGLLETLSTWRCPELHDECLNPTFNFSPFTTLVYEKFCVPKRYQDKCKETVKMISEKQNIQTNDDDWSNMTYHLDSSLISSTDLQKPCVQMALYESRLSGHGYFHETLDLVIPFCGITWCGFDSQSLQDKGISSYVCMPNRCKAGVIVSIVVCALLGTLIVAANLTVIIVFYSNKSLRNSQAVYKISLAMADLLVGAIVLPTFISTLDKMFMSRQSMGGFFRDYESNEIILNQMNISGQTTAPRYAGGDFEDRLSQSYLNFVGFFTYLSLMVSIYTLMMASFDRFLAVSMPMQYSRHNAKNMALWSSLALWGVSILFSLLPLFVSDLQYNLVASVLVASSGKRAVIMFSIVFIIPLIFVWITTIATFMSTVKHARARRRLTINNRKIQKESLESRLAKTLAIMVGVFTLTLLPTAAILICSLILWGLDFSDVDTLNPRSASIYISVEFVCVLILTTNSLWNCFIYNIRSEEFKSEARLLYRTILHKLGFVSVWNKTRRLTSRTYRSTSMSSTTFRKKSVITMQTNLNSVVSLETMEQSERARRISTANSRSYLYETQTSQSKKTFYPMDDSIMESTKSYANEQSNKDESYEINANVDVKLSENTKV